MVKIQKIEYNQEVLDFLKKWDLDEKENEARLKMLKNGDLEIFGAYGPNSVFCLDSCDHSKKYLDTWNGGLYCRVCDDAIQNALNDEASKHVFFNRQMQRVLETEGLDARLQKAVERADQHLIELIKSMVSEKQAEEFFKVGKTGESLFNLVDDITQYDHVKDHSEYAGALIENMIGSLELEKQEKEDLMNAQLEIDARDDKA